MLPPLQAETALLKATLEEQESSRVAEAELFRAELAELRRQHGIDIRLEQEKGAVDENAAGVVAQAAEEKKAFEATVIGDRAAQKARLQERLAARKKKKLDEQGPVRMLSTEQVGAAAALRQRCGSTAVALTGAHPASLSAPPRRTTTLPPSRCQGPSSRAARCRLQHPGSRRRTSRSESP